MSSRGAVLAAFLLGCLVGAVSGSRYEKAMIHRYWRRGPNAERAAARLTRDLGLDDDQRAKVELLLVKHRERMIALHEKTSADLKRLRLSFRSELQPLLKPEQEKKFHELTERWDRKRAAEE